MTYMIFEVCSVIYGGITCCGNVPHIIRNNFDTLDYNHPAVCGAIVNSKLILTGCGNILKGIMICLIKFLFKYRSIIASKYQNRKLITLKERLMTYGIKRFGKLYPVDIGTCKRPNGNFYGTGSNLEYVVILTKLLSEGYELKSHGNLAIK